MPARILVALSVIGALCCAVGALPAFAGAVGGGTYTGWASDHAKVMFTVSSDGTIITSYQITGVVGSTCDFEAGGPQGVWAGAPVSDDAFSYTSAPSISFAGTFAGAGAASGTFRLTQPANSQAPACDSGLVNWTATTPSGGDGGSGAGSGSGSGTGAGSGAGSGTSGAGNPVLGPGPKLFPTWVKLRKLGPQKLGGRLSSPVAACRARRTVILWRGSRRIGSTRSRRNGTYAFATELKHVRVRASVKRSVVRSGICSAGSSIFMMA